MCAASPARNSRPWRIGAATKLRIGVTPFWMIRPMFGCQPSRVVMRAIISSQIASSVQLSIDSSGGT